MKNIVLLTLLLVVIAAPAICFAAQIQPTVNVSGAVGAVCRSGAGGSLSFAIDPSLPGPIPATVTESTVFCSNGTPFTITAASTNQGAAAASCASSGGGIIGTLKDGVNTINYTFSCGVGGTTGNTGTGLGHGNGKEITLGLAGSVAATSYQDAAVSAGYTDTITLTITY